MEKEVILNLSTAMIGFFLVAGLGIPFLTCNSIVVATPSMPFYHESSTCVFYRENYFNGSNCPLHIKKEVPLLAINIVSQGVTLRLTRLRENWPINSTIFCLFTLLPNLFVGNFSGLISAAFFFFFCECTKRHISYISEIANYSPPMPNNEELPRRKNALYLYPISGVDGWLIHTLGPEVLDKLSRKKSS